MRKTERVIFFFATKFNRRDYHRFGFDILEKRGYKVEAWDFSPWHRPDYYKYYNVPDPITFTGHVLVKSENEIKNRMENISQVDTVVDPWMIINDYPFIQDIIQKEKITFGNLYLGSLPDAKSISNLKSTLVSGNEKSFELKKTVKAIFRKIVQAKSLCKPNILNNNEPEVIPSFIICGGEKSNKSYSGFSNVNIDVIKAHSLDYDRYLEEESKNDDAYIDDNYAIFLDEYVPFHPDYLHHGIEPDCDPENYYTELNHFFKFFEKCFGLSVLIAAHPRANYQKRKNLFDGRQIVIGNTIHYVKYSTIVLSHLSTAKSFSILYNKPIIFLDSDSYSLRFREEILGHATALGESPVNISNDLHLNKLNGQIDKELYKSYKETYIKEAGTPEKPVWDVYCDYLDSMNV